jgi:hypothetical protein
MAAIIPFLNDASFDQKGIEAMSIALEEVCRTLDISKDNKAAAEVVAIRIIELARQGERSPIKLSDRVLSEANGASGVGHERHPKSAHNLAVADAAQSMTLDQVDITRQLAERQPRVPDYASQKRATADLMRVARESPTELLGRFVDWRGNYAVPRRPASASMSRTRRRRGSSGGTIFPACLRRSQARPHRAITARAASALIGAVRSSCGTRN